MKGKYLKYIKRICDDCPCLNTDYESGSSCNLKFNTQLIWVHKTDNTKEVADDKDMRSHQGDFDLINASDDCELQEIRCKGDVRLFHDINKQ